MARPRSLLDLAGALRDPPRLANAALVVIDAQGEYGPEGRLPLEGMAEARAALRARPASKRSSGSREFSPLVHEASERWGVSPALVHAVITAESNYDPEALSRAGAMGLMQLMPGTARRFGVADPWDPEQNVHGGVRYLRELLDRFQNLKLALAAYNAGEGAVEQHGNQVPPYQETQTYVQRVMGLFFRNLDRDG